MMQVLAVDGNILDLKLVELLLRPLGAVVTCAQGIQEALALARGRTFDLIIVEVDLPDGGGLEVTRILRRRPAFRGVPILATAFGAENRANEILQAGCNAWVSKPLATRQFVKIVRSLLTPS